MSDHLKTNISKDPSASDPEKVKAQEIIEKRQDFASFLSIFTDANALNFSFLSVVYLIMTAICVILFYADKHFKVESVAGYYVVFMPFVPCAIWALTMRMLHLTKQLVNQNTSEHRNIRSQDRPLESKSKHKTS